MLQDGYSLQASVNLVGAACDEADELAGAEAGFDSHPKGAKATKVKRVSHDRFSDFFMILRYLNW